MQQIPQAILDAVESIHVAPMPQVLLRFLSMAEDDAASVAELAQLVGQDPALSARVLVVANSVALRRGPEIKGLEQCLIALGTRLVRTLAACLAVQSVFTRAAGEQQYDYTGFWGHSLRVAEVARLLAIRLNYPDVEEAYLAGLLHDIGQLLLLGGVGERYGALLVCSVDEAALTGIEEPLLGTNHSAVGAWLVDQWGLSSFMADAILFHHNQAREIVNADLLSQIVWSAHVINPCHEIDNPVSETKTAELTAVESMLGIDLPSIANISRQSSDRIALLAAALGITESPEMPTLPCSSSVSLDQLRSKLNDNDEAHSQLQSVVRDMAILQSLQHNLSALNSEAEILCAVRESARILFGVGRLAFFLIHPDKSILSAQNIEGQPALLQRLEIKLDPEHSLAAAVALGEQAYSTFDKELPAAVSLVDIQIGRALGSRDVLYVPMCIHERRIGIMAYGLSEAQFGRISKYIAWMTSFAHLAAVSIESWREMRAREQRLETALTSKLELKARKVVHEAGNPLSIIKNYLKIISQKQGRENGVLQELDILREEIDRVVNIVKKLSNLSELSPALDIFDINSVIEGMLTLYAEPLFTGRGITLETSLAPGIALVNADLDSVKQILLNLWKNASEALSAGGRFVVSTHDNVMQGERSYIEVRLSDSGPGLPPDVTRRLFQPLEPNRLPGHSGVGLSVVAELVERIGGHISCQSEDGVGTRFSILLQRSGVARG